uniref:TIR domain-containing protein n=1 Tax=Panagrellus redivivus TaxID=6233 RepID=A0A7E4VP70_PANRE
MPPNSDMSCVIEVPPFTPIPRPLGKDPVVPTTRKECITYSHASAILFEEPPTVQSLSYDVFLGGSCGHTVWRSEIVVPYLQKHGITYYNPQRAVWKECMIHEEAQAKENSKLFLFVLDPGTINATSFLEIANIVPKHASKLVVVLLGRQEWSEKALPEDFEDRIRTCDLIDEILKRHDVPLLTNINDSLNYIDDMIIGSKTFTAAMSEPLQRVPYIQLKAKRAVEATKTAARDSFGYFKSRCASITSKAIIMLMLQVFIVLALHFYFLPAVPLMFLIIPLISLDYLIAVAAVIYFRFKARRKKQKLNRKVVMPAPPIPRIGQSAVADHARKKSGSTPSSVANGSPMDVLRSNDVMNFVDSEVIYFRFKAHQEKSLSTAIASPMEALKSHDVPNFVDSEVRTHFKEQLDLRTHGLPRQLTRDEKLERNGCVTSPVGYDVFLSCSSGSELEWIRQKAVPQLHKSGLTYTSAMMCDKEMRIPMLHTASHILYYIPSYKTFLSGMIEIAYFIGHSDWQVTVCVPREAECLVLVDDTRYDPETVAAVERRNASYRMAFCYLKDMAQRRQCRVFTKVEEAIKHIGDQSRRPCFGSSSSRSTLQ